jgi:hypothetical protein
LLVTFGKEAGLHVLHVTPEGRDVPMSDIQIRTPFPEKVGPLLKEAIDLEKKLTRDSLAVSNERIATLATKLGIDVDRILAGAVARTEENEMALLELEGELEIRRVLEEALHSLESVELCG